MLVSPAVTGLGARPPPLGRSPPPSPSLGLPAVLWLQGQGHPPLCHPSPPDGTRGEPRLCSQLDFGTPHVFLCFLTSKLLFLKGVHFPAYVALFFLLIFICPCTLRRSCTEAIHPFSASGSPAPRTLPSPAALPTAPAPSPADAEADPQPCLCSLTSWQRFRCLSPFFFFFFNFSLIISESLLMPNWGPRALKLLFGN